VNKTRLVALVMCAVLVGACGSDDARTGSNPTKAGSNTGGSSGAGACALSVEFRGHSYIGHSLAGAPPEGESLGTAVLPACNDTGDSSETDEQVEVVEFPGVSPDEVIVWPGHGVLVRDDVTELPPEVERLRNPPPCDADIAPIRLFGTWTGIVQPDGNTDLQTPYGLEMSVTDASDEKYLNANLSVRVPASLDKPLDKSDVKKSLWEGGDIEVVANCEGEQFIVEQVEAFPPS